MTTNYHLVSAARPDLAIFGSLHLQTLFMPEPGDPGFLAMSLGVARTMFGSNSFIQRMPSWTLPTTDREDAIRGIGQSTVLDLDPAEFQTGTLDPKERGKWAVIDYRQPQIAHGMGPMVAQESAAKLALGYLLNVMENVTFNAGVFESPAASGLNVTTLLGAAAATDPEAEVTDSATSLPFDASADPWTASTADAVGLLKGMIAAYVGRHGVRPNTIYLTSQALENLIDNDGFQALTDDIVGAPLIVAKLAKLGLSNVEIALPNIGLAPGTVILCRREGVRGGDPRDGYQPLVLGGTDQIDSQRQDYAMGTATDIGAPNLASIIGYRYSKVDAGSIERVRAACNFDTYINYRGLVRATGVLG